MIGFPSPRRAPLAGASRCFFFSPDDDEDLGFLLAGKPKLKDQHMATQRPVLCACATSVWAQCQGLRSKTAACMGMPKMRRGSGGQGVVEDEADG